jgi:PBSX family phage terminase large subunit
MMGPLSEMQRRAWWAVEDHRTTVCDGSVRSGKSVGMDHAFLDFALNGPRGNLLLAGRTQDTIYRNVIEPMVRMDSCVRYNRGTRELHIGDRLIYVVGADNELAQEKIRGVTLVAAYVDEASTIPESFWTFLLSRLSVEGARLMATTNPDSPMHWLKKKYLDRADELGIARFQFRLPDNLYNPLDYVEAIKREFTGLWRRRLIDGEWAVAEGAVYEMWEPSRHVLAPDRLPPVPRLLCVGVDYGTSAPTAGLLIGISAEERPRLVVVDEWAPPSLTDSGLSASYRKWIGARQPERVIIDPSAASFHKQLWADGVPGVILAENAVVDGIRTVASLLSVDRLVVSSACTHLLTEMPSYSWDAKATAKGEDKPVKQNDHFSDALRYGVYTTQSRWRNAVPLTLPIEIEEAA